MTKSVPGNIVLVIALIVGLVLIAAVLLKTNYLPRSKLLKKEVGTPTTSSSENFKTYKSDALKVSFDVPETWLIGEYLNTIVIGNNQMSLDFGNNVNLPEPGSKNISVQINSLHLLQNQTLDSYLKEASKSARAYKTVSNNKINGFNAITVESSYQIGGRVIAYRDTYIEKTKNNIYSISVTPIQNSCQSSTKCSSPSNSPHKLFCNWRPIKVS